MRNVVIAVALATGAGAVLIAASGRPGPPASPRGESESGGKAEGPPDEWMLAMRLSRGTVTPAELRRASLQADRVRRMTEDTSPGAAGPRWTFQGPEVIGGRIVDLAVDPAAANTVYAAAATGGVWKSTDAGGVFRAAWPIDLSQAVGAMAITPSGRLYAGTGESNPGGGSITFGGKGVYSSSDGGAHWDSLGLSGSERIGRIAVDPADETRVFVAATGPLFTAGGERGVYLSTDSGQGWTRVLQGDNDTTGASDVHVCPLDTNRVYAVMWDHLRVPDVRRYGGPGSGIYRSTDAGANWARLGGGLPPPGPDVGRIGLGVAPTDPDRLYAIYIDSNGSFSAFYASVDGGDVWTQVPASGPLAGSQSSYGWWFARIWVDPADPAHLFVAGVSLVESTNGGTSWTSQGSFHADQHAMAWVPGTGRVYLGNDGGVYRSETSGHAPWTFGAVQPFTQFYTLDVGEQNPSRIVGGAQDNGCNRSYTSGNPSQWNTYDCADGLETLISFENQDVVYGCSQYGSCDRSTNGGDTSSLHRRDDLTATQLAHAPRLRPERRRRPVLRRQHRQPVHQRRRVLDRDQPGPDGGRHPSRGRLSVRDRDDLGRVAEQPPRPLCGHRRRQTLAHRERWCALDPGFGSRSAGPLDHPGGGASRRRGDRLRHVLGLSQRGPRAVRPEDRGRRRQLDGHHRQPAPGPRERHRAGGNDPGRRHRPGRVPDERRGHDVARAGPGSAPGADHGPPLPQADPAPVCRDLRPRHVEAADPRGVAAVARPARPQLPSGVVAVILLRNPRPMTSPHGEAFQASLKRCLATPDFLHDFYETFVASSEEVREKFKNTDFPRQTRVLADSLFIMAVASESKDDAIAWKELARLAERHSRSGLDIRPKLYEDWLECLIVAVRRHDPAFSVEVEDAWRRALAPGIEHLRAGY